MATCPNCGRSSREDPEAMVLTPVKEPWATVTVAENEDRLEVAQRWRLSCVCGWSIEGNVSQDGQNFEGVPVTQVFPVEEWGIEGLTDQERDDFLKAIKDA